MFKLQVNPFLRPIHLSFSVLMLSIFCLLLASCSAPTPPKPTYTGHWICKNAYLTVMDSMSINRATLPPFELVFREGIDSMLFLNPLEIAAFPIHKNAENQRTVIGFIRDSISTFTLSDDGNLHFVSGNGQMDFFKADSNLAEPFYGKWKTTLKNFYVESLISGKYLSGKDSLSVSPMGVVRASKTMTKIDLLMGGDDAQGNIDMAIITKPNGEKTKIGWRILGKKLNFYALQNSSSPKEKPYWTATQIIESWEKL